MTPLSKLPIKKGARVLIRVDYNVPLRGGKILDARRIKSSYETIDAVLKKGGIPVLIAHLGDGAASLQPVARFLSKRYKIIFIPTDISAKETKAAISDAPPKTVVLLENIRRYPGEEKNDKRFAKALAALGACYVNDAFSVSHRAHASVVSVPALLPSAAGYQLQREIDALSPVLEGKKRPFLFILGGAKFGTKVPLLERFGELADGVVIAGAILNTFYKAAGFQVGASVVEAGYEGPIRKLLDNPKLLLPTDVVVQNGKESCVVGADEIGKGDTVVDIGPASVALIAQKMKQAKLVVWNGPTGWYEKGFDKGTVLLARALLRSKAKAIIGGGDTAAVLEKMLKKAPAKKNIFISTGGGATLDFLAKGTLPGIAALG